MTRAPDLPVGTVVRHNGRTFKRDRVGGDGWWCYPEGFYMDYEVDRRIADGAEVHLPETKETQ